MCVSGGEIYLMIIKLDNFILATRFMIHILFLHTNHTNMKIIYYNS